MKISMPALTLPLFLFSMAKAAPSTDLILQTRMDPNTASWLIDKTRIILNNTEIGDGLSDTATLSEDPVFTLDDLAGSPALDRVKEMVAKVFHVKVSGALLRIRIPEITYQILSLHAKPESLSVADPILNLKSTIQLQGVNIELSKGIQIDFMIPDPATKSPESYLTATLAPTRVEIPKTLDPAEFDVSLEAVRDQAFHLNLTGSNLDALPGYVSRNLGSIRTLDAATRQPLSSDQIKVNPIIVKLNHLTRSLTFDEFKPLVQKHLQNILSMVLKQVGESLKTTIGPRLLKTVFNQSLPSQVSINTASIYSKFTVASFEQPSPDQLALLISGDLCTGTAYQHHQEACSLQSPIPKPIRIISDGDQEKAKAELKDTIASGQTDVGISVSEEYLNRLLKITIDSKLWEQTLKEQNLELGPKGAFLILNQANRSPELYLDVLYKGAPGLQRILISPNHPLRFPLRIATQLSFEVRNGTPVMNISIEKLISDASEVIRGIPEYDLQSHLIPALRKKVASLIIKMAEKLVGKNVIEMEIPILKGIELEKGTLVPSAFGRINLFFKLRS